MISKISTNLPRRLDIRFIKAYLDSGDLERARQLLDRTPQPDLQLWTLLVTAYTKQGHPKEAVNLYAELRQRGRVNPDKLALLSVAKACAASTDLFKAKEIHEDAIKYGFGSDLLLGNAMIDMYGKCKYVDGAKKVFNNLRVKDVISWTSLCSCYVNCGLPRDALLAFRAMALSGIMPNAITASSILPACSDLKCLNLGREVHGFAIKNGMEDNRFVSSALVDMYASCSSMKQAELVFCNMPQRDVVSWNVMISAYFLNDQCDKAFNMFDQMRHRGVKLNHASWNAVIRGLVDSGQTQKALELFSQMQRLGFKPNQITVTSILPVYSHLESLRGGKEIHAFIVRNQFSDDLTATTALVFMYAKCGDLELCHRVFSVMPKKDTVAWNTIIISNSVHGRGEEALMHFIKMVSSGVKPNSATFTGVLSGCSHSRLVEEGLSIFHSMSKDYKVEPNSEHFSCMVDILSRGGCLMEAYEFLQQMPFEPSASAWGALLGACRIYKNVDLGRIVANHLFEIEPNNPGNYVLFFNILVTAKLWEEASETRKLMRDRGIKKVPGCSWIQVMNRVHTFVVGDKKNDQNNKINEFLNEMLKKMKSAGHLPATEFVLQDLDAQDQEESLCNHSEKLAVAFGILNLKGESCIRVFKNLRICGDCHNTIKFIAKSVGVQIIVRDSLRFHHFKDGLCSCKDFW